MAIPLVSSYFPIKKALSENLKEALSIFNKKISDITVQIVKLDKLGISPAALLSAILFIIMGFATYYLAPLSFLLNDYSIFLLILNVILIVMILGLIFMLQLIVPYLQLLILNIIILFAWKDKNIYFVVKKNLEGHSSRNQKTSIMFMIALSFVIFAGCTLELVSNFIIDISKSILGGDIWVHNWGDDNTLEQNKLIDYFNNFNSKFPNVIKNYTFMSYPLNEIIKSTVNIGTLCGYRMKRSSLVSVDTSFVNSGYSELYTHSIHIKN